MCACTGALRKSAGRWSVLSTVLRATTEIARAVGGETDPTRVLETIAKRVRALIGARSLLVLLREEQGFTVTTAAGECGHSPIGQAVSLDSLSPTDALDAARSLGVNARAALVSPLNFRGKPLGAIVALDRIEEGPDFYAEDERMLVAASASAATAVATVQSVSEERLRHSLLAAERERARWARDLHDSTLQGLGSRRILLSSALKRGGGPALEKAVAEVVDDLTNDIEELRALITSCVWLPSTRSASWPRWRTSWSASPAAPASTSCTDLAIGRTRRTWS